MGMFDSLYSKTGQEWQTKAFGCGLRTYNIGDRILHDLTNFQVEVLGGDLSDDGFVHSYATVRRGVLVSVGDERDEALPLVDYGGSVYPVAPPDDPSDDETDFPWPHDPTEIVKEALREYVGDGDGIDARVLSAHLVQVQRQALLDFAAHFEQHGGNWGRMSIVEYIQGEYIGEFVTKEQTS